MEVVQSDSNQYAEQAAKAAEQVTWLRNNPSSLQRIAGVLAFTETIGMRLASISGQLTTPNTLFMANPGATIAYGAGALAVDRLVARPLSRARQYRKFDSKNPEALQEDIQVGTFEVLRAYTRVQNKEDELQLVWAPPFKKGAPSLSVDLKDVAPVLADIAERRGIERVAIRNDVRGLAFQDLPEGTEVVSFQDYVTDHLNLTGSLRKKRTVVNEVIDPTDEVAHMAMLLVPAEALRRYGEDSEETRLSEVIDWIVENKPSHPVARIVSNHEVLSDALPAVEKSLKRIIEGRLQSTEQRWEQDTDSWDEPGRLRKRVERTGFVTGASHPLKVQWRYSDGNLDGRENIFHALDTSESHYREILETPERFNPSKSLRAYELEALTLCLTSSERRAERRRRLQQAAEGGISGPTIIESVAAGRLGGLKGIRMMKHSFATSRVIEHRPLWRSLMLCSLAGSMGFGLGAGNYSDSRYYEIRDRVENEVGDEMVYEETMRRYKQDPFLNGMLRLEQFDDDIDYLSSKAIIGLFEKFEIKPPGHMRDTVEGFESDEDSVASEMATAIQGFSGSVGNTSPGKNRPIISLEAHDMSAEGYWAMQKYEYLYDARVWEDLIEQEFGSNPEVDAGELPAELSSVNEPYIRAATNMIGVFKQDVMLLQKIDNTEYYGIPLPVLEGTSIVAAHMSDGKAQIEQPLYTVYNPISNEQLLLLPSRDYKGLTLTYWLQKDDTRPVRAGAPIFTNEFTDPEVSSVQPRSMSQLDYYLLSRDIWKTYIPDLDTFDPVEQTRQMEAFIKSGEYTLSPFEKNEIQHSIDIVAATLRKGKAACSTANTALVLSSPLSLSPVGGFYNSDGSTDGSGMNIISTNEAHLWAVDKMGTIYDATPSSDGLDVFEETDTELADQEYNLPEWPVKEIGIGIAGLGIIASRRKIYGFGKVIARKRAQRKIKKYDSAAISTLYHQVNHQLYAPADSNVDIKGLVHLPTPPLSDMSEFLVSADTAQLQLSSTHKRMLRTFRLSRR